MSIEHQPYRKGARAPGAALDAMRAGKASPAPGAALMQSVGQGSPTHPATASRHTVQIPRASGRGRNLRAQWPVKTQR